MCGHSHLARFLLLFGILLASVLAGCTTKTTVPGSRQATVVSTVGPQAQVSDGMTRDELKLQVMGRFADRMRPGSIRPRT